MRYLLVVLSMLLVPLTPARADVHVGIGISVPGVSIGINMPAYPRWSGYRATPSTTIPGWI